eukprot:GHVT01062503.1.p1 GENE.GHVT01062503.1~~GHVT01062503.1.p1  ORF type:complete len:455 (-),score=49.21 GHVT01062503.1:739-1995(-)
MAEPSFTNELTPRGSTPPAPSEQTVSLDSPQGGSANRDAKKPPAFLGLTVPWLALGVLTLLGGGALGKLILIDPPTSPARVSVISPQNLPAASSSEPKKTFLFPKGVPAEFSSPPQSSRPELGAGGTTPPAAAVAAASLSLFTPQEMDECLHRVGFNGSSTPTTGRPGALRGRRLGLLSGARAQKCLLLMTSFFILAYQGVRSAALGNKVWTGTDGSANELVQFSEKQNMAIILHQGKFLDATAADFGCGKAVKCDSSPLQLMAGYACKIVPATSPDLLQYCITVANTCAFTKKIKDLFLLMKVPCNKFAVLYMTSFEEMLKMFYPSEAAVFFNGTDNISFGTTTTSSTNVFDYNEANNIHSPLQEYVTSIEKAEKLYEIARAIGVVVSLALIVWLFERFTAALSKMLFQKKAKIISC